MLLLPPVAGKNPSVREDLRRGLVLLSTVTSGKLCSYHAGVTSSKHERRNSGCPSWQPCLQTV